jgi:replicative DNA helicase
MANNPAVSQNPGHDFQPQYDLEAETGLLGSIILDDSIVASVHEVLDKEYFYNSNHQIIYAAMLKLYDERSPIDLVTLKSELEKRGDGLFDKVGGLDYLTNLVESVSSTANSNYYAKLIREKYILRAIMLGCNEILRETSQSTADSEYLLDKAQHIIFEVAQKKEAIKMIHIKDILTETFEKHIMTVHDRKGRLSGLSTGLAELDDTLGGLRGGQLIVVAGRPGSGKSSFGLRLLEQTGLVEKKAAVIYTLEVTSQEVVTNLLCCHARVDSQKLRRGLISAEEIQELMLSAGQFEKSNIFIDDSTALTPFDLRSRARRLKADHDIQLILVDYLQLMMMKDADSREREIAQISYSLKSLAKELGIPVVAMAQLSRAPEHREAKQPKPRLSDLRESGAIEQDADVVLLLYRDELYNPNSEKKNICEIIIAKQRNGPTNTFEVQFQKEYTRFETLYKEEESAFH